MSAALVPAWRRIQLLVQGHSTPLAILVASVVGFDTLLLVGRPDAWVDIIGAAFVILTAAIAVILTSGIVSRDLKAGTVQLWLQKPVDPVRYYLARLVDAGVAASILIVLVVLAARVGVAWLGWSAPTDLLLVLPRLLLTGLLVSSIAFGLSPWINRGEAVGTLVVFFAGMIIERDLAAQGALLGPTWTPLVRAVLFPESALAQVTDWVAGEPAPPWSALGRIAAYGTAWVALGMVGVRRAIRGSGLARAQGEG